MKEYLMAKDRVRHAGLIRWFLGLLAGIVFLLCASIAVLYFFNRPKESELAHEQAAVFREYLFGYPLVARPLPTLCKQFQQRDSSHAPLALEVLDRTLSEHDMIALITLPKRVLRARGVPISAFADLLVRNLTSENIKGVPDPTTAKSGFLPVIAITDRSQGMSVTFTKAGFDRNFSWAIVYAEVKRGSQTGTEYVYLTRDWKHGQHWYVAGLDRITGSTLVEEKLP
jgi:hypothetical protein